MRKLWMAAILMTLPVGWAAAQQEPAPLPRDGFPSGPPAKILSFTAEPRAVEPGQAVTLKWAVVNADRLFVNENIGTVAARGSRVVTPPVTTIYTLTAVGYSHTGNDTQSVTVTVAGTTAAVPSPAEASPPPPRMDDGRPDLSGVYIAAFRSMQVLDRVQLKPGAEKFLVGTDYGFDLTEKCLPPGVPGTTEWPYPLQIVQKPGLVVILYEAEHLSRVVPTDGRPHPDDLDATWMGNSVGRWDGDTLVVDVTGFNDQGAVREYRHTSAYHVIERYHRTAYDTIAYEATVEDPNVFVAPWRISGILTLHPEWDIQEYVCEENNHDYKELFNRFRK
jgi:hypothetical protein